MKLIYFAGILLLSFVSCSQNKQENATHNHEADNMTAHHEESPAAASGLVLNNGEKWKANPETTTGVQNMIQLADNFNTNASAEDFQALKTKLETEFNTIIDKCTMTGEAHEQLHLFLIPMVPMMEQLADGDAAIRSHALAGLKEQLNKYNQYFL